MKWATFVIAHAFIEGEKQLQQLANNTF